jgi:hypothetical protein
MACKVLINIFKNQQGSATESTEQKAEGSSMAYLSDSDDEFVEE